MGDFINRYQDAWSQRQTNFDQFMGALSNASSIAGAIRDTAQLLPKARAFHIWFEHVSIGTTPVLHMQHDPETLESRLKLLHGQFWG
ncbi:hypothetical protein [Comamonas sp. MYb396]|uniref:hypothetical protein n=1 Tax=Comamonas sp. MYb396 TaxID=2745302 RepID=UPI0030DD6604